MKKVTYKTLTIQNFLSVGNDEVVIDTQRGLNLITGKNIDNPERANGSGKSSVIEGFFYAIFGNTIRKIKKEFVINNVTKGKGNISLEFDVETDSESATYKVTRQLKPSQVQLTKNGEDITANSIGKNKEFISELIGSNPTLTRSCDILSLSDNTPFMAMEAKDKRKFVEDIFSMEIFAKMLKDLKELIKENNQEISITTAKIEEINNSLDVLSRQEEAFKKQLEEREKVLKIRRESLEEQISKVKEPISTYIIPDVSKIQENVQKLDDAWGKIDGKIGTLNQSITERDTKKKLKHDEIRKASSVSGATCDKCLQDIPHTHIEHLQEVQQDLKKEFDLLVEETNRFSIEREEWKTKKALIQTKLADLKGQIEKSRLDKQKLENLKETLIQHQSKLKELDEDSKQQETPIFKNSIQETEDRKKIVSGDLGKLKLTSEDLDVCKFILGEEGVKSFVVKKLLGMLNSSIQQYINDLGMTMRCKFDEYFDEQMTNDKGKEISYWNLSGGERRTVDLSCSWAFKDIRRKISGISSNVEFLDEILDSAMDERGVDLLIELIKKRIDRDKLSVYAISHRKETLKHIDADIIQLEKENGITRRVS